MRILNKLFTKNRFKTNIECVYKHSIVCSALKHPFFSQEILGEERLPTGSHEENNALLEREVAILKAPPYIHTCGSHYGGLSASN